MATTNKDILERLEEIEGKLPNGDLEDLKRSMIALSADQKDHADQMNKVYEDVLEIKDKLLNPEDGLVVRVNKNTYWRKQLNPNEFKELLGFRNNVTKALWVVYAAVVGLIAQLFFSE